MSSTSTSSSAYLPSRKTALTVAAISAAVLVGLKLSCLGAQKIKSWYSQKKVLKAVASSAIVEPVASSANSEAVASSVEVSAVADEAQADTPTVEM